MATPRRPDAYAAELARMVHAWTVLVTEPEPVPPRWEAEIARMRAEVADLRARGEWRSGARTLLRALGVHHNEVFMCAGLAWLLTPDGWHGLGTAVLDGLLAHLEIPSQGSVHAVVVTEEPRADTRADIIVRFEGVTLLIEAKVWAHEQTRQADRLAQHWDDESPHLIFLTRSGAAPLTAVSSRGRWRSVAWSDLATIIAAAVTSRPQCEPGVREYLRTLEAYGGTRQ